MASQPTDFLSGLGGIAGLPHPYEDGQEVVQNQNALRTSNLQQQAAQLQIDQQTQAQQRQQQFHTDIAALGANPTPAATANLVRNYPEFSGPLKTAHDIQDEAKKASDYNLQAQIYSAAQSQNYRLASKLLKSHRDASVAAGEPVDPTDDAIITALDSGDLKEQKNALAMIGVATASIDPDKFDKTFGKPGGEDKGFTLGDGQTRYDAQGNVVASAPKASKTELKEVKTTHADGSETTQYVPVNPDGTIATPGGNSVSGGGGQSTGGNGAPISVRNNNPGAIRFDPNNQWQGQTGQSGGFVTFDTPANGQRAHQKLIANQIRNGFDTPLAWAQHYAPASDGNDPTAYAQTVAKGLGIGINDKIPLSAVPKMQALSAGVEAGGTPARGGAPQSVAPQAGAPATFATKEASDSSSSPIPENLSGDAAQSYLQQKNPGLSNRIAGILAGKIPYPNATRKETQPILNAISQIDPSFDATTWKARNETNAQYAAGGAAGKVLTSGATAVSHLYDLALAAQKLPDHTFGFMNSLEAKGAPVGSDTGKNLIQFNRSRTLYAPEVAKYLAGTGQAAEGEVNKHYNSFDPSLGRSGNLNNLVTDTKFITDKFDAQAAAYQQTMGKPLSIDGQGKTTGPVTAKLAALRWWADNQSQPVPTVVSSPAQASKLPAGTLFVTPDGRILKAH